MHAAAVAADGPVLVIGTDCPALDSDRLHLAAATLRNYDVVVIPAEDGGVDLIVSTQWLHVDRVQVAPCLGLEPEQVRIHLAGVGGAFGGREDLSMQIHAAMLALRTGRPAKMVYSREIGRAHV